MRGRRKPPPRPVAPSVLKPHGSYVAVDAIRTVHEAGYAGKVRESLEQLHSKSSADNFMVRG